MLRFLSHRVGDRRLIQAGTIEEGRRVASTRGTPQGSVISPVLSNIYLHYALDLWVQQWRTRDAKGDVIIVRYADDSVIGFQYEGDAQRFLQALRERLAQFGLQLRARCETTAAFSLKRSSVVAACLLFELLDAMALIGIDLAE